MKRESRYTSISAATNGDKIDRENTRKCVMQTHKAQPKHNTSSLLRTKASFVKQSLGLRQNLLGVLGLAHHGGGASTNLNWRLEVAGRKKSAESEMEKKIAERRSDAAERLGRVRQWRQSYCDQIRQARDKDSKIFKDRRVEINDNIKTKKNGKFIRKSEPKDKEKIIRDKQLRVKEQRVAIKYQLGLLRAEKDMRNATLHRSAEKLRTSQQQNCEKRRGLTRVELCESKRPGVSRKSWMLLCERDDSDLERAKQTVRNERNSMIEASQRRNREKIVALREMHQELITQYL